MANPLISFKEYLKKGLPFCVPYYQRGYIWGKSRGSEKDSVQFLVESITHCYNTKTDLFLQGVTVCENTSEIELIDGQQRTTALYLLLQYLNYKGDFSINYPIRTQSQEFLNSLKHKSTDEILEVCSEKLDEQYQDIYYFKKSIRIIHNQLKSYDKLKLIHFLLDEGKVKFLYIDIPKDRAMTVFSMMNGNKAEMRYEEIIKAEMLRLVSKFGKGQLDENLENPENLENREKLEALRWDQNLTRSKYAREWDKWLYWWNKNDVKKYYHTSNVMGLLVETYFYTKTEKLNLNFNFETFRDNLLRGDSQKEDLQKEDSQKEDLKKGKGDTFKSKMVFYELRQLQKRFEDVFNSYDAPLLKNRLHNKIGAILTLLSSDDRKKFISKYFVEKNSIDIDEYLKLVYLRIPFSKIEKDINTNGFQIEIEELVKSIENDNLYNEDNEPAFRQLIRRNVEEDTKLGRKFDFSIWKERSLEHIYPKSKVYHWKEENGKIIKWNYKGENISETDKTYLDCNQFDGNGSEHCIGNLVLLYKNENSSFGAKNFNGKKVLYFDLTRKNIFRSLHLLHTISVFANEKWGIEEIQKNKTDFITEVKNYYEIQ